MGCEIEVREVTEGGVVSVSGDADLNSAELLRESLERAAAGGGTVVVDLSGATLLDSRTIGVLATGAERLGASGRRMPIVSADRNVLRLFSTIGLENSFCFFPTVEAALAG